MESNGNHFTLEGTVPDLGHDSSTNSLIRRYIKLKEAW
jgi:hypothetical protein